MKRLLVLAALLAAFAVSAQPIDKQTFAYAVKGGDTLRLDRYTAAVQNTPAAGKPCLMFAFGGGFVSGTRDNPEYVPYFEYYARQGYAVVSIDYRRGLKTVVESGALTAQNFPMAFVGALTVAVEDLYDATAYVCSQAATWGVDPRMIVASGSSAGAITVLMGEYGICNSSHLTKKLPQNFNYAGIIAFAGAIFDMGDDLEWERTPAPIMLFHGDADSNVPYDVARYEGAGFFGSKYIAGQLTAKRVPHWFYSVANIAHSMAGSPMYDNRYEIDTFLQKMVLGHQPLMIDTFVVPTNVPEVPKVFTMSDYIQANFGRH